MIDAFITGAARVFEVAGILAMLGGSIAGLAAWLVNHDYHDLRRRIARAILLGLELLIAADIIATITVRPTLDSVFVLAIIVLIRTLLSFTLELEATGRFPWQRHEQERTAPDG